MTIPRRLSCAQCLCAVALLLSLAATPARAYDWLQFGGDPAHSGRNTLESTITKANVGTLVQKYSVSIGATADGAPVFLESVSTAGGIKDLLFVTTMDGRIIALDAATGAIVWSHQYGPGTCKINNGGSACYTTSSPAIDPNRLFVYSYGLDGFVHKYQVGDGTEILTGGWPQLTTTKGFDEKGSGAISFATSGGITYLYVVHGGYPGDGGDYQGHVTAINLATGSQKVFNAACSDKPVHLQHYSGTVTATTCASHQDAIWSRPGVIYDAGTNRIFMGTGNGTFSGNSGGFTWSESVFALQPDGSGGTGVNAGKPVDSYTPSNYQGLDNADADLGSTAPAILPVPVTSTVQHLAAQAGKDAQIRLINLANMSGLGGPGHVMGELGAIQVGTVLNLPQGGVVLSQPAVWVNPADNSTWVFVVNNNGSAAYKVVYDGANNPSLSLQWNNGTGGTSPVIANNILFNVGGNTVRARDPVNGAALWSTSPLGGTHWHSLIVANGAVYTTDGSAHLFRFALPAGLNPTTTAVTTSLTPSTFGTSVTFTATITGGVSPTGTIGFADAGTTLAGCGAVAVAAAKATCTISTLAVGTHSIVATYSGDAANAGSISPALTQVVNPAGGTSTNVALASNGGVATASSTFVASMFPVAAVNNGNRAGTGFAAGGVWVDGNPNVFPDWVQITFNGSKTIDHVIVYSMQDNYSTPVDPPATMTFSLYGLTDFQVQGWNGCGMGDAGHGQRQQPGEAHGELCAHDHRPHSRQHHARAGRLFTRGGDRGVDQRRWRRFDPDDDHGYEFAQSVHVRHERDFHGDDRRRCVADGNDRIHRRRRRHCRLHCRRRECGESDLHDVHAVGGHAQHRRHVQRRRRQRQLDQPGAVAGGELGWRRADQRRAGQQRWLGDGVEHVRRLDLPRVGRQQRRSRRLGLRRRRRLGRRQPQRLPRLGADQLQRQQDDRPRDRLLDAGRLHESGGSAGESHVQPVRPHRLHGAKLERQRVGDAGDRCRQQPGQAHGEFRADGHRPHSRQHHARAGRLFAGRGDRGVGELKRPDVRTARRST